MVYLCAYEASAFFIIAPEQLAVTSMNYFRTESLGVNISKSLANANSLNVTQECVLKLSKANPLR